MRRGLDIIDQSIISELAIASLRESFPEHTNPDDCVFEVCGVKSTQGLYPKGAVWVTAHFRDRPVATKVVSYRIIEG